MSKIRNLSIKDLINIPAMQVILDSFYSVAGQGVSILDLEGNVLAQAGWQQICTQFHRVCPETAMRCLESDTVLSRSLSEGNRYNIYNCKDGMVDVAVPIIVGEQHVGDLFTGQFFLSKPDLDFFTKQAEEFGFDKTSYLQALAQVPIKSEAEVQRTIDFLCLVAVSLGKMGLVRLELEDLTGSLSDQNSERLRAEAELKIHKDHLQELVEERTRELSQSRKAALSLMQDANLQAQRAETALARLQLNESRLRALQSLNEMTDASTREITDFALEEAVTLTRSSFGYIYFMSEDENVRSVHRWTKATVDQEETNDSANLCSFESADLWKEAIRLRKPIISNDQTENIWMKGGPEHQLPAVRHLNVPVFDGKKIVAVAIVGNKKEPYDETEVRQLTLLIQGMWQLLLRKKQQEELLQSNQLLQDANAEVLRRNVELERARDEARLASRAKSEFVATMSHEIRTPLSGMLGMIELLSKTPLSSQQSSYIQTIMSAGNSLKALVNDIVTFSKIEAGKISLETIDFDLGEVVEKVGALFAGSAAEKKLSLHIFVDPKIPPCLLSGDPVRIGEILNNLTSNAIKFSDKGSVLVKASLEAETDSSVSVLFTVRDSGIGMTESQMNGLFEAFSQADNSITRKYGGAGLGLFISRRLVNLMEGKMSVSSLPGKGSTFAFTVTFQKAVQSARRALSTEFLNKVHVLVVDADREEGEIIQKYLASWGARTGYASSGAEGLGMLREAHANNNNYAVAIIDCSLPAISLVQKLRSDSALKNTGIVFLNHGLMDECTEQANVPNSAVCQGKPIRRSCLLESLETIMECTRAGVRRGITSDELTQAPESSNAPNPVRPERILIVEDHQIIQEFAVLLLKDFGFEADVACDGEAALEALATRQYGLVLMDIGMPGMDGMQVTRLIRSSLNSSTRDVPVIAMTAEAMEGTREKCIACGMNDYITKPVNTGQLKDILEQWLPAPMPPDGPASRAEKNTRSAQVAPVDLEWLEKRYGRKNIERIRDLFFTDASRLIGEIRLAIRNRNAEKLLPAAHGLKGVCATFSANTLRQTCLAMETAGHKNNWAVCQSLLQDIDKELKELEDFFNGSSLRSREPQQN